MHYKFICIDRFNAWKLFTKTEDNYPNLTYWYIVLTKQLLNYFPQSIDLVLLFRQTTTKLLNCFYGPLSTSKTKPNYTCILDTFVFSLNSLETASAVSKELIRLMKIPVDNYNNVLTLLKLEHFGPLFEYFDFQARKTMSIHIVNNALENETIITTPEQVCCYVYCSVFVLPLNSYLLTLL